MKKITAVVIAFLALFMCLAASCADNGISSADKESQTGIAAEQNKTSLLGSFKAIDINSAYVDDTVFKDNKLTMVNVWGTFCSPCIGEMPELGELNREYKDKGFGIVGIVCDAVLGGGTVDGETVEKAKDIVSKTNADYIHIVPTSDLTDFMSDITAFPTTFFVNEKGEQVGKPVVGAKSKEIWKTIIDERLAEVNK